MQVVGDPREREPRDQFGAAIGDAIAIDVLQLPEARRRRGVDRAVVPEDALGERQAVGEDGAPVEAAITVGVLQAADDVGGIGAPLGGAAALAR